MGVVRLDRVDNLMSCSGQRGYCLSIPEDKRHKSIQVCKTNPSQCSPGVVVVVEPAVPGTTVAIGVPPCSVADPTEGSGRGDGTKGSASNGEVAEGARN